MHKLFFVSFFCFLSTLTVTAQQPRPTPEQSDVIRVDASLVQTNVTVFDKRGTFVEGLRPEDFELRVDGRQIPISFLSRITAGTTQELNQLSAARKAGGKTMVSTSREPEIRGRTIIFFIDDLHLSAPSVNRTRQTILNFFANQMGQDDQVAVASASGQIGFLQQFTNNKAVLRAAIGRLNHRPYTVVDHENVPMTEYIALRIDQGDRDAISYYTNQLLASSNFRNPGGNLGPPAGGPVGQPSAVQQRTSGLSRELAERQVKERAQLLIKQATAVTTNTLASLESLMRSSARREGRKLVFFISDGFFLNDRNTGFASKLHELTDAAVRAGVVIYSLDAQGLKSTIDVTSNRADPEGKLSRSTIGEITASQDALSALAGDTGGRALFDSDKLNEAVDQGLKESSNYYLIAWRPLTDEQKSATFKSIEIRIPARPELQVRIPKGFFINAPASASTSITPNSEPTAKPTENVVDSDLKRALSASSAETQVPTTIAFTYIDTPDNGPLATASVQVAAAALDYGSDPKQAAVDVAGVILNDSGKAAATFRTRLTVNAISDEGGSDPSGVIYNYKAKLTPGIYQVRTAVRDEKSGRMGSASEWIEIPDLSAKKLTLSSLLLRPIRKGASAPAVEGQFSVDHHFPRTSQLNFFIFIYNASRSTSGTPDPNLTAQVEVFRNGKSIVTTPVRTLTTAGMQDLQRIPYGGQFQLESLPGGRYELQVTIVDQVAKTAALQRVLFLID